MGEGNALRINKKKICFENVLCWPFLCCLRLTHPRGDQAASHADLADLVKSVSLRIIELVRHSPIIQQKRLECFRENGIYLSRVWNKKNSDGKDTQDAGERHYL
jgi:hypothetical protein